MYLKITKEFSNVRLNVTSNQMSSTLYVEELPNYISNEKVRVFSLYFYFRGNKNLDVRKFLDFILKNGDSYNYDTIKRVMMDYCKKSRDSSDYSFSEKETSGFNIKPRDGFVQRVTGVDFTGSLSWDSFIFSKEGIKIVSTDGDSARQLFKIQILNPSFLNGKSYNNLINILKDRDYHFEEYQNGRR